MLRQATDSPVPVHAVFPRRVLRFGETREFSKVLTEPRKDELPLEARLAAARKRHEGPQSPRQVAGNAFAQGTRLALELVAGVLVGAAIGYLVDRWLGTMPLFSIGGFLLGLAAGFMNLVRAVKAEQAKVTQAELDALPVIDDDDEENW